MFFRTTLESVGVFISRDNLISIPGHESQISL